MSDTRQQLGDQPEPSPGANAAGEAGAAVEEFAPGSQDAGAETLAGDVDELVSALAQRDDYLALAQRTTSLHRRLVHEVELHRLLELIGAVAR